MRRARRATWVDTWVDFGGQHIAHYENNQTYFVHSGRLGTAGIVTDYSGAVIQDELHYPWGQEWTGAGTMMEERFASLNHRDSATFAPGLLAPAMRRALEGMTPAFSGLAGMIAVRR